MIAGRHPDLEYDDDDDDGDGGEVDDRSKTPGPGICQPEVS